MKKEIVVRAALLMCLILFLMSCASQQYARKCNGKRGAKTNMGVLWCVLVVYNKYIDVLLLLAIKY